MALWAGRFSKEIDETVNAFNSSIAFDARSMKQSDEDTAAGSSYGMSESDSAAVVQNNILKLRLHRMFHHQNIFCLDKVLEFHLWNIVFPFEFA